MNTRMLNYITTQSLREKILRKKEGQRQIPEEHLPTLNNARGKGKPRRQTEMEWPRRSSTKRSREEYASRDGQAGSRLKLVQQSIKRGGHLRPYKGQFRCCGRGSWKPKCCGLKCHQKVTKIKAETTLLTKTVIRGSRNRAQSRQ